MKQVINVLGRFSVVFLIAFLIEIGITAGRIFDSFLWEYWIAWVVQACYFMLIVWVTMFWCEEDGIIDL